MEVLFVHGALVRDGSWWWHRTEKLLDERWGIRSRAVALPSCGEAGRSGAGLTEDAAMLRRELDSVDSAVVVGHSYGGTVIAEAGAHPAIEHLLYISSYLPHAGMAQGAIMADEPDPVLVEPDAEGRLHLVGYTERSFGERFLQDTDAATVHAGWERVTAQSAAAFVTPTTAEGWQGVDSTYLVCLEDRSTSVRLQRVHAARATRAIEIPTGHHPFLSRPELVAQQVAGLTGWIDEG